MKTTSLSLAFACFAALLAGSAHAQESRFDQAGIGSGDVGQPAERHGPDYRHASTAYEGAVSSQARCLDAAGRYNLNTAMSARHWQAAQAQALRNEIQSTVNFFQKKQINKEFTQKPRPTAEDIRRVTESKRPERLDDELNDLSHGELRFPSGVVAVSTPREREFLANLFAERTAYNSGRGTENQLKIARCLEELRRRAGEQAREMPPQQHIAAVKFLQSLNYEALLVAQATS